MASIVLFLLPLFVVGAFLAAIPPTHMHDKNHDYRRRRDIDHFVTDGVLVVCPT